MTEVNQVPIHCETCQKSFDYTIYQNVNVTETPELKEKLINQTVFQCTCPHCGQKYFIPYILNYQDMDKKILIHFFPKEEEMQKELQQVLIDDQTTNQDFLDSGYAVRYVGSCDEFFEKLCIAEEGYDDRIIEIVKYYCVDRMLQKNIVFDRILFSRNLYCKWKANFSFYSSFRRTAKNCRKAIRKSKARERFISGSLLGTNCCFCWRRVG